MSDLRRQLAMALAIGLVPQLRMGHESDARSGQVHLIHELRIRFKGLEEGDEHPVWELRPRIEDLFLLNTNVEIENIEMHSLDPRYCREEGRVR